MSETKQTAGAIEEIVDGDLWGFLPGYGDPHWWAYSNGFVLVASEVSLREGEQPFPRAVYVEPLLALVDGAPSERTATRAELLEFSGYVPHPDPCEECDSTGKIECDECSGMGETECECSTCHDTHESECQECGGKGSTRCEKNCTPQSPARPGRVLGLVVDRNLLYRAVAASPFAADEKAELFVLRPKGALCFRGEGWRAVVMERRDEGDMPEWTPSLDVEVER